MTKTRRIFSAVLLGFLLGIHDGRIALWKDGVSQPLRVFPYRAEMLPLSDQQALEKGIALEDESDLVQLLEDYLS